MNTIEDKKQAFERLLGIMDDLREQCPWDRKQTMESLRNLTIEETYELADAILKEDLNGVKEEIGDILLHLVFYSKIGSEKGAFDIADVINGLCEKLISRHPHIYGDVKVADENEVKVNWEKLKMKEGKKSVLSGVPGSLPALIKALRIQDKSKQVGFEWENSAQVWAKVEEELQELKEVTLDKSKEKSQDKIEEEFGDLLFALVNYARFINVDPETALERTNHKFIKRFSYIEEQALMQKRNLQEMTLEEMDALWNEAKRLGRG
ncbi:MAG: nucleoside triphosphate pyrophosphohydrolase [Chitinophagales bacterium]|nr:nucleoside triphosphate pyrophosphohydrolase [Chitinophagales bacterium]